MCGLTLGFGGIRAASVQIAAHGVPTRHDVDVQISLRAAGAQDALWRALIVFRIASLVFVCIQVVRSYSAYLHPAGAVAIVVAMAAWTLFVSIVQPMLPDFDRVGQWHPPGVTLAFAATDLAVAVGALMATRLVDTSQRIATGAPTLPGTWTAAAVLGAAIAGGARLGVEAAIVLSTALVLERGKLAATTTSSATLLILAGLVVGYLATTALHAEQEAGHIRGLEAARAERDRLGRTIHDGALQALAFIAREALVMDRETIARLASEQETTLRSSLTALALTPDAMASEYVDVRPLLTPLEARWSARRLSLAMPAEPVRLRAHDAEELAAAIRAALDNVDRHAGPSARVWVLVEDEPGGVVVTVRDDGVGMSQSRIAEAHAVGRIGLASSIIGRVRSLGGAVSVTTSPNAGVEVEMRVPRR